MQMPSNIKEKERQKETYNERQTEKLFPSCAAHFLSGPWFCSPCLDVSKFGILICIGLSLDGVRFKAVSMTLLLCWSSHFATPRGW